MKIYFEQSGGFTGIGNNNILINSNSLPPEEAVELQRLVDIANFFNFPSETSSVPLRGADYLEYKITIETSDNKKHSIKVTDLTMPSNIGPLIRYLRRKAAKEGMGDNKPT
jgi:hypothetical protein